MVELVQKYRELDRDCALFYDLLEGNRSFGNCVFIPLLSKKVEYFSQLNKIITRCDQIDAPDEVFAIIKEQMKNFMQAQKMSLESAYERPFKHINGMMYGVSSALQKDSGSASARADIVLHKLGCTQALIAALSEWIDSVLPVYLQELIGACDTFKRTITDCKIRIVECLPQLDTTQTCRALEKSVGEIMDFQTHVRDVAQARGIVPQGQTPDDGIIKFEEGYYRDLLKNNLGIELSELLSWYEPEVEKTRAAVFEIVKTLDIPEALPRTMAEVNDVLMKYAGSYESAEAMMKKAQEYLDMAKNAAREYAPLPEETCLLCRIPESIKYSYPWGGYGGGCKLRRPLIGEYYVNDFNYTAVTDGWIKMMALHEAYAGHHVQFVRTTLDPLPEVVKIGARSVPITEGTAHRSERLFEYIYKGDQFYPLFVAYRRHHTSVRVKAELWLRYFGRTVGEVTSLYCEELGFDRDTARGQVSAQESMQGYFNSYYYGMKKIEDLEQKYGFSAKEYTGYLFDVGRVSIEIFERFLALSPADKKRYKTDFASLIQFG